MPSYKPYIPPWPFLLLFNHLVFIIMWHCKLWEQAYHTLGDGGREGYSFQHSSKQNGNVSNNLSHTSAFMTLYFSSIHIHGQHSAKGGTLVVHPSFCDCELHRWAVDSLTSPYTPSKYWITALICENLRKLHSFICPMAQDVSRSKRVASLYPQYGTSWHHRVPYLQRNGTMMWQCHTSADMALWFNHKSNEIMELVGVIGRRPEHNSLKTLWNTLRTFIGL